MTQYDDDEAFENGVLRDGARRRVGLHMRDSRAPMITDGTSDPLGSHRPGWRIPTGGSESDVALRDSQRKLVEEAHAEYLLTDLRMIVAADTNSMTGAMKALDPIALSPLNLPWRGDSRAAA